VSENVVYPFLPNGFADHYPVFKWLFHWEYTLFSDKPISYYMNAVQKSRSSMTTSIKTPLSEPVLQLRGHVIGILTGSIWSLQIAPENGENDGKMMVK
jgi:hypothetical protein